MNNCYISVAAIVAQKIIQQSKHKAVFRTASHLKLYIKQLMPENVF